MVSNPSEVISLTISDAELHLIAFQAVEAESFIVLDWDFPYRIQKSPFIADFSAFLVELRLDRVLRKV